MNTAICNLCSGTQFVPGPNNRMTEAEQPPQCKNCGSLERHRIARQVLEKIKEFFKNSKALQFSHDMCIEESWFKSIELSVFEKENSLDIQKIDRPDKSYDFIFCIHILEHVQDDAIALSELERILSAEGFVFLMVPYPALLPRTIDWGYPHPAHHNHYRLYGKDFAEKLARIVKTGEVFSVEEKDTATEATDICYFIAGSKKVSDFLRKKICHLEPISRN